MGMINSISMVHLQPLVRISNFSMLTLIIFTVLYLWECLLPFPLSCYIIPLPSSNLPLLSCGNNHLCLHYFLLCFLSSYIRNLISWRWTSASSAALSFCSRLVLLSFHPFQEAALFFFENHPQLSLIIMSIVSLVSTHHIPRLSESVLTKPRNRTNHHLIKSILTFAYILAAKSRMCCTPPHLSIWRCF